MFFLKITDFWIQTTVLWCLKRPLCQLWHNHEPLFLLGRKHESTSDKYCTELFYISVEKNKYGCIGSQKYLSPEKKN